LGHAEHLKFGILVEKVAANARQLRVLQTHHYDLGPTGASCQNEFHRFRYFANNNHVRLF